MTRQSTSQFYLGKAGWNPQLGLVVIKAWWSFKIIIKSLEVNRRMRTPLVVGFNPSYLLTRLLSPQSCFLVCLCCICVCVRERYTFYSCCSVAKSRPTVTPWTTEHQASLSFTIPQSLLKLMSIETVMPSNHLILCHPPSPTAFNLSQHQGLFQWVSSSLQVAKVLELQFQHQSFQWIFRLDFL